MFTFAHFWILLLLPLPWLIHRMFKAHREFRRAVYVPFMQQLAELSGNRPESGWPIIIFNHGYIPPDFYVTTERYLAYVDFLARRGCGVFMIDLRGHGGSTNTGDPDSYRIEELSADLAAALSALEIPACDLLGHSMGGMVALHFALTYPDRVRSLVLMDTVARSFRFDLRYNMFFNDQIFEDFSIEDELWLGLGTSLSF